MTNTGAISSYDKTKLDGIYSQIENAIKSAYESVISKNKAQEEARKKTLNEEYDKKKSKAYVNARLSAIGNNETLAGAGLAGGLYLQPKSGVSESSRIAIDNSMRNNLNDLENSRRQDEEKLSLEALLSRYDADKDLAEETSKLLTKKIDDAIDENHFEADYDLDNFKAYLSALKLQNEIGLNALSKKTGAAAAYELKRYGKVVNSSTAQLLGVPVGTSAADVLANIITISTR